MNNSIDIYSTLREYDSDQESLRYSFVSTGEKNLIKSVAYNRIGRFNGRHLYNMGFGDFNPITGGISDNHISNNGDHYKVFNTVLHTVPLMFKALGKVSLMVQGSDSKPEFIDNCKKRCTRNCEAGSCKKAHRRIIIYRRFVENNYTELKKQYAFYGSEKITNHDRIELFQKNKAYRSIFCYKKID